MMDAKQWDEFERFLLSVQSTPKQVQEYKDVMMKANEAEEVVPHQTVQPEEIP